MSKAEERALEMYPPLFEIYPKVPSATVVDFKPEVRDWNMLNRQRFMEGYETAEKDLAPLIEAAMIVYEAWNGGTMDDVRREMVELGKRIKEARHD